jgi:hypothetical protein
MERRNPVPWFVLALCLVPGLIQAWRTWHVYPASLLAPNHQLVVRDYLNIWAGGHAVAEGRLAMVFQPNPYYDWLRSLFGPGLDLHTFSYPPHLLLLAVPFSILGLLPGFFAWIAFWAALLWAVLRRAGMSRLAALAVLGSPAMLENALVGQTGALSSGVALGGGLLLAGRQPVLAGALLGLLTLKPQAGLLVPACLLAGREWRTIAWAVVFGALYCAAGLIAFGWQPWVDYATQVAPFMTKFLTGPLSLAAHYMMVPPYVTLRVLGVGPGVASAVQVGITLACMATVALAWMRPDVDRRAAVALALCLAPMATPYFYSYDLVGVAVACVLLAALAMERGGFGPAELLCLCLGWLWPGAAFAVGVQISPGLGFPVLLLPALVAATRVWGAPAVRPLPESA